MRQDNRINKPNKPNKHGNPMSVIYIYTFTWSLDNLMSFHMYRLASLPINSNFKIYEIICLTRIEFFLDIRYILHNMFNTCTGTFCLICFFVLSFLGCFRQWLFMDAKLPLFALILLKKFWSRYSTRNSSLASANILHNISSTSGNSFYHISFFIWSRSSMSDKKILPRWWMVPPVYCKDPRCLLLNF